MKLIHANNIKHDTDFILENYDIMPQYFTYFNDILSSNDLIRVECEQGFVLFLDDVWVLNYLYEQDLYLIQNDIRLNDNIFKEINKSLKINNVRLIDAIALMIKTKFNLQTNAIVHSSVNIFKQDEMIFRSGYHVNTGDYFKIKSIEKVNK